MLQEWIATVASKLSVKISSLETSMNIKLIRENWKYQDCISSLKSLQDKFVIVPMDKASGNIGFMQKY